MARLRTQDKGRIAWFDLVDQFDVGPASAGSARLLESPLNGPVMRIVQDNGIWKVLAFPGTGYDIVADQAAVHAGWPRTVVDGSSIRILRGGDVKFEATFEDADELEERMASLRRELRVIESQLAAREAQLEAARAEVNPLKERLVSMERQRRIDETALFKLRTELDVVMRENEEVLRENHDLRTECQKLNEEREQHEWKQGQQVAEIQQLRSSLTSVEMLLESTQDNAVSQSKYQAKELRVLTLRVDELQGERERLLQLYNESSAAVNRLLEDVRVLSGG